MNKVLSFMFSAAVYLCLLPLFLSIAVASPSSGGFRTKAETVADKVNRRDPVVMKKYYDTKWLSAPWTGDDAPYIQARKEIEIVLSSNPANVAYMKRLENAALADPDDPLAQYKWVYAYYYGNKYESFSYTYQPGKIFAWFTYLDIALSYAKSPHTLSYDRLRYLIDDVRIGKDQIALRILAKDTNDREVRYWLFQTWCFDDAKHDQAYAYIADFAEKNPNVFEYQEGLLAWYLSDYYLSGKKPEKKPELDKAMAIYQRMLKMTSPKMKDYKGILKGMNLIKKLKSE